MGTRRKVIYRRLLSDLTNSREWVGMYLHGQAWVFTEMPHLFMCMKSYLVVDQELSGVCHI